MYAASHIHLRWDLLTVTRFLSRLSGLSRFSIWLSYQTWRWKWRTRTRDHLSSIRRVPRFPQDVRYIDNLYFRSMVIFPSDSISFSDTPVSWIWEGMDIRRHPQQRNDLPTWLIHRHHTYPLFYPQVPLHPPHQSQSRSHYDNYTTKSFLAIHIPTSHRHLFRYIKPPISPRSRSDFDSTSSIATTTTSANSLKDNLLRRRRFTWLFLFPC